MSNRLGHVMLISLVSPVFGQGALEDLALRLRSVDDVTRTPVSRAKATLSGGTLAEPVLAYSADDGSIKFMGIPAGQYRLAVEKPGYFGLTAGQRGSRPLRVELTAGQPADLGDVVLTRFRRLRGKVNWSNGDVADGAMVEALGVRGGRLVSLRDSLTRTQSDSQGEFKFESLPPGRYVIVASKLNMASSDVKPLVALPAYFPAAEVSASIDLRTTAEYSGVNVILEETKGSNMEAVVEESSVAAPGVPVMVGVMARGPVAQPFAGVQTEVGKPFRLTGIPPGDYHLLVGSPTAPIRVFYPLSVGLGEITRVRIPVVPVEPLVVTVTAEPEAAKRANEADSGKAPVPEPLRNVVIQLDSQRFQLIGMSRGQTNERGEARIEGLAPGETYDLNVGVPAGTYIQKVRQGGQDLTERKLEVRQGAGPIEILLGRNGGTVEGRVQSAKGRPAPGFAVLVPASRSAIHRYRSAAVPSDGVFRFEAVAPGSYKVYALERNNEDSYLEPGYLEKQGEGVTVEVRSGAVVPVLPRLLALKE